MNNREHWLTELAKRFESTLFPDLTIPKYRVTCGFPSTRARSSTSQHIGECWPAGASKDSTHEIIVSMVLATPMKIAGVLAHEMVHMIVGLECGHKKPFKQLATKIGLTGKMTATEEGEAFKRSVQPLLELAGDYPHAVLNPNGSGRKKQSARLLKCQCTLCGYTIRVANRWLVECGAPICPACNEQMTEE